MDILRQKANTKRPGIVQAATSLFAARGIDGVSMRDIAQAAGVREAAIYRHFASKDELAREIFVSWYGWHCQQVHQIVTGAGGRKEQLRDIVGQEFTVAERYPEAFLYFCEYRGRCDLDSFSLRLRHLLSLSLLIPLWFWAKVHHTKRGVFSLCRPVLDLQSRYLAKVRGSALVLGTRASPASAPRN